MASMNPLRAKNSSPTSPASVSLSHLLLKQISQKKIAQKVLEFGVREIIFEEGEEPKGLYCVNKGMVKIYKMDSQGHHQIVRLAGPGDLMGYRCLLAHEHYTATAETIEKTALNFISRDVFFEILKEFPDTTLQLMKNLAQDLRQAEYQLLNIVHKKIGERLAELFLVFKDKYGYPTRNGIALDVSLTRGEMAELIGTTPESVMRLISQFKARGLIEVDGRRITLRNIDRLTQTASLIN